VKLADTTTPWTRVDEVEVEVGRPEVAAPQMAWSFWSRLRVYQPKGIGSQ
jgi:hypothetical protein